MNPERNYKQQMPNSTKELESALYSLQAEVTGKEFDLQEFDLIEFLDSNGLLQGRFVMNLNKWPLSIRKYIKKELIEYVQSNIKKEFRQEDLQVIGGFFETALQEPENCVEGSPPDENWVNATKALAHELRDYYGLQENDGEELPCWRRG